MDGKSPDVQPAESMKCWTNPFDEYKNTKKKSAAWVKAVHDGTMAVDENNQQSPVKNFDMSQLAFVAGWWRVQKKFDKKITRVRDKDFFIGNKLDYHERTKFDFYEAYTVNFNCYGYYIGEKPDYVVAIYDTDQGRLWGYGKTIQDARAFLGIKLYDICQDIIHDFLNRKHINRK